MIATCRRIFDESEDNNHSEEGMLDPQGKTVQNALEHMGYTGVNAVHVGKYLEIEFRGQTRMERDRKWTRPAGNF